MYEVREAPSKSVFYLGGEVHIANHDGGLQIVDARDLDNMAIAGSYQSGDLRSVEVVNNIAYIGDFSQSDKGFYLIDVASPSSPVLAAKLEGIGSVRNICIENKYAYLIDEDNDQLVILQIAPS